jgi:hypothetical protein
VNVLALMAAFAALQGVSPLRVSGIDPGSPTCAWRGRAFVCVDAAGDAAGVLGRCPAAGTFDGRCLRLVACGQQKEGCA